MAILTKQEFEDIRKLILSDTPLFNRKNLDKICYEILNTDKRDDNGDYIVVCESRTSIESFNELYKLNGDFLYGKYIDGCK